jgi:hypothetical protein
MTGSERIIILAGAPEIEALDWDEDRLHDSHDLAIARFLNSGPQRHKQPTPAPTSPPPKWRALNIDRQKAVVQHDDDEAYEATQFLSFNNEIAKEVAGPAEPLDFLEHSIAILENIDSSQLLTTTDINPDEPTQVDGEDSTFLSIATTDISFNTASSLESPSHNHLLPNNIPITDLKHIPSAAHILSLHPQTLTLNLIAGIISISQPRTITLRKRKGEMEIIELTVGDETRAGFCVNFWLTPTTSSRARTRQQQKQNQSAKQTRDDGLRATLGKLRTGDVVLMRHVALSSFRGCVYGQSLGGGRFGRVGTSIVNLPGADFGRPAAFREKVRRVRKWTDDFVGIAKPSRLNGEGRGVRRKVREDLPPDTQE